MTVPPNLAGAYQRFLIARNLADSDQLIGALRQARSARDLALAATGPNEITASLEAFIAQLKGMIN